MNEVPDQKTRLMEAAIDLFASKGFRGTSIRDIAHAHGTSISNIYHYFGSKEGLLVAILQHLSELLLQGLRQAADSHPDPVEGLERLIETHLRLSFENLNGAKVFILDEEHFSPEGNKISRDIQMEVLDIYLEQLRRVQAAGRLKSGHLKVMAFNILACVNWQMRWFRPRGPLSHREVTREILSFILHGIMKEA
ncbi:MAG: TetR/AcrR family transcriptional regulator [Thermodesulfobacteriota bacterium]